MNKDLHTIKEGFSELIKPLLPYLPAIQSYFICFESIDKCGTFEHEIYHKFYKDGFDQEILKRDWDNKIFPFLKNRWPKSLISNERKIRIEQIFKAISSECYFPACAASFSEMENIINYDILDLKTNLKTKDRTSIVEGKNEKIKKNKFWGIDDEKSLPDMDEIFGKGKGIYFVEFLLKLDRVFRNSNNSNLTEEDRRLNRHLSLHGRNNSSYSFIDALNCVLIIDMLLQSIKQKLEQNLNQSNSTSLNNKNKK